MRRFVSALAALAACACTNPEPTDQSVVVRIELDAAGNVQTIEGVLAPEVAPFMLPRERGSLVLERLEGDPWTGSAYVSLFTIAEEFQPRGISGSLEPVERQEVLLAMPDDGRSEIPLRVTLTVPDGPPVTSEHTITVRRDVGASAAPLVEGDVGARREALSLCGLPLTSGCNEPEEFCYFVVCREEACLPDETWDGSVVEIEPGADQTVLFVPLAWDDPDEWEQYTRDLVNALHVGDDWFRDNRGRIGFSTWRQACEFGDPPDFSDRSAALQWLDELFSNTRLLPPADRYVVVANTQESSQGRAYLMGSRIAVSLDDSILMSGAVLSHELGHSVAGLADEYDYDTQAPCASSSSPNLDAMGTPKWFCAADTGETYAGQSCGPHGGLVGQVDGSAASCSNAQRPCDSSLMRQTWDGAQFDPVGYGAMTYAVDTGEMMGYEDCAPTCDTDCASFAAGTCGFNDCFQLCDQCEGGERCGTSVAGAATCRAGCPAGGDHCRSSLGFEFCDGEAGLTTDAACPGMMLRRVECRDGDMIPIECVDG